MNHTPDETDIIVTIQDGERTQKVLIIEKTGRSHYKAKDIERGPGWNEEKRKYTGVKFPNGWMRGQNYCYGEVFEIQKKQIIKSKKDEPKKQMDAY